MQKGPATVIALTLLNKERSRILVGVRNPENNSTHPDVVSTPTQRVPHVLMDMILDGLKLRHCDDNNIFQEEISNTYIIEQSNIIDSRTHSGHNPLIYLVESILSRKLGLSEHLEQGIISFSATPRTLLEGTLFYANKPAQYSGESIKLKEQAYRENVNILNVEVIVSAPDNFPDSTSSYSSLRWIPLDKFKKMILLRDATVLSSSFGTRSIHYCVKGLCLASAYLALHTNLKK